MNEGPQQQLAGIDNAELIEARYTYDMTFQEIMGDNVYESHLAETKDLCFNGTPRLKKGLNQVKFLYKLGYHSGVTRVFRYGFSIIQHEKHLQVRHIDQARFTAGNGQTPEQKEELLAMWSNLTPLCPDLKRTVSINVSVRKEIAKAITDSAEVIGICAGDLEIVLLYTALLQCDQIDEDILREGRRFIAHLNSVISNKAMSLKNCGGV